MMPRIRKYLAVFVSLPLAALAQSNPLHNDGDYFQPNSTGIKVINGFERVFIQPFGPHGVRVRVSLNRDPAGTELSTLIDPPLEGPGGDAGLAHDITVPIGGNATLRNGNILASVYQNHLYFYRLEANDTKTLLTSEYFDTKSLHSRYYARNFMSTSFRAEYSFTTTPDEQFFGLGQQSCCNDHTVNKKGQVIDLINFNSHIPMPVYMSNKGYLQMFNMASQGRLEMGSYRVRFVAEEAMVVDYWITAATPGNYDDLQRQFTAVTGRQPTPPEFMLGFQQSKLRYYDQKQVEDLAQRFHDEEVKVSLIVIDFLAWKYQGDWSFNNLAFPNPEAMARKVKELTGAELMVSLWPSVEDLSENYLELHQKGLLATTRDGTGIHDSFQGVYTRLIDSTNPEAREFVWKRLNDSYFSKGIHNFWIDQADGGSLGEAYVNNDQDLIKTIPYHRPFTEYFVGTQESTGKMYPWFHEQTIDEGYRNLTGSTQNQTHQTTCEYMSLTRSTYLGGQRFCSYLWSGDTESRFDVMHQQVTSGVSVAASGISAWTLDIGGFSGLNPETPEGQQLFVRWFGLGVFLPFTRVHGTRSCSIPRTAPYHRPNECPNEPWSYGEENFEIIKKYIDLRYQLIPYVKALFEELQKSGRTIMRPLYYDFSLSDPVVAASTASNEPQIVYQYMFGPRLLVAPIGEANVTEATVYLPQLGEAHEELGPWKNWWTDEDFGEGGEAVTVDAPLDQIPVFYLGSKEDIFSGSIW